MKPSGRPRRVSAVGMPEFVLPSAHVGDAPKADPQDVHETQHHAEDRHKGEEWAQQEHRAEKIDALTTDDLGKQRPHADQADAWHQDAK